MIEIKEAVRIGKEILLEVYENPDEVVLNSVDLSENMWLVTFRVPLSIKPINSLQNVLGINKRIFYKTVKIDKEGNVLGIVDEDMPKKQLSEIRPESV